VGNTIIEINGKRYDAQNGTLLGKGSAASTARQALAHRGRVIDGFVKPGTPVATAYSAHVSGASKPQPATPVAQAVAAPGAAAKKAAPRQAAKTIDIGHKPQKAKTLMRHVVHKPALAPKKPVLKAQAASEVAAAPVSDLVPHNKVAAHTVNNRRLQRARTYDQHHSVQRFTTLQQNYPVTRTGVQAQRQQHVAASSVALPAAELTAPAARHHEAANAKSQPAHSTGNKAQPPHSNHHKQRSADLFEAAIANAKSHEKPPVKAKRSARKKALNIAAGLAAFVALAGFVAYTNMTNIEVRIASMRAGFSAELPGYNPAGYNLAGGLKSQRGVVTATYRSGSNSYTLQQQTSTWDSQTLADNIDAQSSTNATTLQSKGRTVYVYGDKAAWVNGGVLYSVSSAGDISNDEILAIATSM
jgi:hypothetical protein